MLGVSGQRFLCSWSGGKDSCLSLYRAVKAGGIPAALLTMMTESGERSRSHGLRLDVIRAQAEALGLPLVTRSASWGTYEDAFREAVREFAQQRVRAGVFGDIDVDEHREWCVRVCREVGVKAGLVDSFDARNRSSEGAAPGVRAVHPLWKMDRMDVVREFLGAGFQARIVAMKDGLGGGGSRAGGVPGTVSEEADVGLLALLGEPFDLKAVDLLVAHGIDACGEAGEFHTVVTAGPMFRKPLAWRFGERVLRDGCWFVDGEIC